ncbi:MAG: vitamin K epoxide reductase family protein [Planctomycetaceae bacterium]
MSVSSGTVVSEVAGLGDVHGAGQPSVRMLWMLRGLCVAGLGISVYLAWTALSMTPVYGCGGGEVIDCGHVLKSKWSKVFGIPVSVPAGGLYASMLVLLGFAGLNAPRAMKQMVWNALTAGACMAGLAALWFISLQIFALSKICPYCVAVHTCGLTMAALMLRNRFSEPHHKKLAASFSAAAVAGLITVQTMTPEPEVFEVIRYDEVTSPDETTAVASGGVGSDVFEAPGEVFAAPGEMFEAPVVDEAPVDNSDNSASTTTEESGEAVKAESTQPVASTLLLLLPPRLMNLTQMMFSVQEAAVSEGEAVTDSATAEEAAKSDAGEKPTESSATAAEGDTAAADVSTKDGGSEATEKKDEKAEPEKADAAPAVPERKLVTVAGNRITLDVKQWPLLGQADAEYVFVEMFDYTCPHCRNTHHAIKGAFENFGDKLAILALPVPLERSCNDAASGGGHVGACELAKISIAVWRVAPEKFHEFHDWMFETTRSTASARAQAEKLVGAEKFQKEYSSKIPSEYVKRHVDLYKKVGQGSVPKLLFPKSTINGEINSKSTMVSTIERELRDVAVK